MGEMITEAHFVCTKLIGYHLTLGLGTLMAFHADSSEKAPFGDSCHVTLSSLIFDSIRNDGSGACYIMYWIALFLVLG